MRSYDNCMVLPASGIISPVELCASNISHKINIGQLHNYIFFCKETLIKLTMHIAIILRKDTPGATQAGSLSPFYVEAEGSSSIHWIKSYFNCSSHILDETKIIKKLQSKKIIYIFVTLKNYIKRGGCIFSSIRAL